MSQEHHADSGSSGGNKRIAIFIAVLAALLAIAETGAKSAQTAALFHNIDATNLWQFFQAKTIRQTALRAAADAMDLDAAAASLPPALAEARKKQLGQWRDTIARYDSEPATQEGRQELMARAQLQEKLRDRAMAAYHLFELSSAAFQIAIVLASATIITGVTCLAFASGALCAAGVVLGALGWVAPTVVHLPTLVHL